MSLMTKLIPLVLLTSSVRAKSPEAAEPCGVFTNYKQIISCAEDRSPEVVKARSEVEQRRAFTEAAGQLLNPEFSVETLSGSVQNETRSETGLSLAFPVELGERRSARKEIAANALSRSELELLNARAEVRKNLLIKIIRLRQIESELELVNESAESFAKLVKQYTGRPALSPEQEVTLTVFRIAKDEYSFKRMEYDEELAQLTSFFRVATGKDLAEIRQALPSRAISLPEAPLENSDIKRSPLLAVYNADVNIAKAEMNRAKGEAWPTLSVGPSAKFSKEGGQNFQQWGANLSMALPLLSLNQGGKAAANAAVQTSQTQRELAEKELSARRNSLIEIYKKSSQALKETSNARILETKHRKVESLFVKGLVPSSLVIEAHRSLVEFEKTRNLRELKALEALLDIQMIDGSNVELSL